MALLMLVGLLGACGGPPSGIYETSDDQSFTLNMGGPSAMTMTGSNGLCVMFWREEGRPADEVPQPLYGQDCSNRTFGDLDWNAVYLDANPPTFSVTPPNSAAMTLTLRR